MHNMNKIQKPKTKLPLHKAIATGKKPSSHKGALKNAVVKRKK